MGALAGKVAVVTGADSAIGLAAAKAFARQGAQVVVTGRRHAAVRAAVAEIGGAGSPAIRRSPPPTTRATSR